MISKNYLYICLYLFTGYRLFNFKPIIMNINVQKVSKVIIKDATGKQVDQFPLGMLGTAKMQNGELHLIIQKSKQDEQERK